MGEVRIGSEEYVEDIRSDKERVVKELYEKLAIIHQL